MNTLTKEQTIGIWLKGSNSTNFLHFQHDTVSFLSEVEEIIKSFCGSFPLNKTARELSELLPVPFHLSVYTRTVVHPACHPRKIQV